MDLSWLAKGKDIYANVDMSFSLKETFMLVYDMKQANVGVSIFLIESWR